MNPNVKPPRWIQSLLKRYADNESLEEVEGDLLEFYNQWVANMGRARANWKYFFTAVTLLRPFRKKRKEFANTNMLTMIRSYFIMSWRTILKNRVSSFINVAGLTLGLTTSLLILLVVLKEFRFDDQHIKKDTVFMIMKNQKTNDGISTGRSTPGPLVETLKSDYPQVIHASRLAYVGDAPLMVNGSRSVSSSVYVDPDMFRMMTYPAIKGDPAAALEANSVVLTKRTATKFFGDKDPMGQTIVLSGGHEYTVGAIIEDIAESNTLRFPMAVPFKSFEKYNPWLTKWDDNRIQAFVELNSPGDLTEFNKAIDLLVESKTHDSNDRLFAYPLSKLHLYGDFSNGQPSGGMINIVWMLIASGVFMLLIACVNFMNVATAQSARRAREVGVRKVLGAARRWIIFQFLNESLLITFLSLGVAIVLCILVVPSFNVLLHASISFEFSNAVVWISALSVGLITALVAGSYPAFVLSRFAPARVLKGVIDRPGGLSLRRFLVTFQFVISISVLIGTIILYAQFDHVRERPMGYDQQNLIRIGLDSLATAKFSVVKNEVSKIPGVRSITGTGNNILYSGGAITGMDWPGRKPDDNLSVVIADTEYDWSQTMGIEIVNGRDFSSKFKSDTGACLLNQSAIDKMGLTNPIGAVVGGHPVIGVFKDYVYNNPSGVISPMIVFLSPHSAHNLYVRIDNNDSWTETVASIEKAVKKISPDLEFEFHFTSDEYQWRFEEMSNVGLMVSIFGGMTIFISCLGLFGLSGFIAERRGKEMSIRKVFGADSIRVLLSLSADILMPVVIALLIVIPLSVWAGGVLLEQFIYRVQLKWWMFAQAGVVVVIIAFLVVLYHGWRTASENPSVRLKSE